MNFFAETDLREYGAAALRHSVDFVGFDLQPGCHRRASDDFARQQDALTTNTSQDDVHCRCR